MSEEQREAFNAEEDARIEAKIIGTVDLTPTWEGILPALLGVVHSGTTFEARHDAEVELRRMARLADKYVAEQAANKANASPIVCRHGGVFRGEVCPRCKEYVS